MAADNFRNLAAYKKAFALAMDVSARRIESDNMKGSSSTKLLTLIVKTPKLASGLIFR